MTERKVSSAKVGVRRKVWVCGLALLACVALAAADGPTTQSTRQRTREYLALQREIAQLFAAKRYVDAAGKCRQQIALAPKQPAPHYNLACALARLGKSTAAVDALKAAVRLGYADADHMEVDPDLESLRTRRPRDFAGLLAAARKNADRAHATFPYDRGLSIKGMRPVEGNPAGGLRYRLRLSPDATAAKPHRLIVWMHPSGGSMNRVIEALSPKFAAGGFALLVLTQKNFAGWSADDARRLMEKTLPAVAKVPGVDARRPILLGYSAGGQMALNLWESKPGAFGGLILDAAYPIDMAAYARGKVQATSLPANDAIRRTPLLVLVGDQDGGLRLWQKVQPEWTKAGVPLTVIAVEGKGHTWLVDRKRLAIVHKWLQSLPGPKPTTRPTTQPGA